MMKNERKYWKRLWLLAVLAVGTWAAALAQSWEPVDGHTYNDETIVYGTLFDSLGDTFVSGPQFVVAAFIDDECRGEAEAVVGDDGSYLYVLRVHGDRTRDRGRELSFRAYDKTSEQEFVATPSRTVLFTGDSEGLPSECIVLTIAFSTVPLEGFTISMDPLCAGETGRLVLTPIPANAAYNAAALRLAFAGPINGWTSAEATLADGGSPVVFNIAALVPGLTGLTLTMGGMVVPLFDASGQAFSTFPIGRRVPLQVGWQWLTNVFGSVSEATFWDVYGGMALTEIRTQDDLLYNDPEWGYFGTLVTEGLPQNKAYKAYMAADHVGRLWNGSYDAAPEVVVEQGWTWMPAPYYYDRLLANALPSSTNTLPSGMVIISKERGTAEWDGTQWTGDLEVLPSGESFLCYNPSVADVRLHFAPEHLMAQGNEQAAEAPARSPWHYDAGSYSDNMTLVATMPDLPLASDYSLGAFVGQECRGEGRYRDGRFFITVHGRSGERVSFRLCHQPTGEQYVVDETVVGRQRVGTLTDPVVLHSQEQVTGIRTIGNSQFTIDNSQQGIEGGQPWYDLSGRRVANPARQHGVLISGGRKIAR